jgi:hypothetical protein
MARMVASAAAAVRHSAKKRPKMSQVRIRRKMLTSCLLSTTPAVLIAAPKRRQ